MIKNEKMKNRYHIQTSGNDDEAYREAIQFACKYVNDNPDSEYEIVLLISQKGSTGWLDRLYGTDIVKHMHQGYKFNNCGASIKLITQRNFKKHYSNNKLIVFILGASMDKIRLVEDNYNAEVIIAVPWMKDSIDDWINAHNPTELRGKENENLFDEIHPIIKLALDNLTSYINLSTGIRHHSDNVEAKTTVLVLTKYHKDINPAQIEGYLVKSNWDASYAKKFADLIRTIQNGKYFKGGRRTGLRDKYNYWKRTIEK